MGERDLSNNLWELMCKGLNEIPPQEFVTQIISKIVSLGEKDTQLKKSLKINP
jgi:hypothetical protein